MFLTVATSTYVHCTNSCTYLPSYSDPVALKFGCEEIEKMEPEVLLGSGFWRNVYASTYKGRKYVVKVVYMGFSFVGGGRGG